MPFRAGLSLPREPVIPTPPPPRISDTADGARRVLHAAVAVVVRPSDSGPQLLFIKRSLHDRDPWSGHMAFPGGKWEPQDPHLLGTAIRETREETGLELPGIEHPGFLGRLPDVSPRGARRLPPLAVTPFLFEIGPREQARVASLEVERIHWVAISALRDPANHGEYRISLGGARRTFPSINVVGEQVWGLTWRIVDGLVRLMG